MSYSCHSCLEAGRRPPTQVQRKNTLCGKCLTSQDEVAMMKAKRLAERASMLADASPEQLGDVAMRTLMAVMVRLEDELCSTTKFDPIIAAEVAKTARAISATIDKVRIARESIFKDAEKETPEEMRGTFCAYFRSLPREQQRMLLDECVPVYKAGDPTRGVQ